MKSLTLLVAVVLVVLWFSILGSLTLLVCRLCYHGARAGIRFARHPNKAKALGFED